MLWVAGESGPMLPCACADRGFSFSNGFRRADVHPQTLEPKSMQPLRFCGTFEECRERKVPVRRALEKCRREDRRPGIDEWSDLLLSTPTQAPVGAHGKVTAPRVPDAARDRSKQDERIHCGRVAGQREAREVGLHPFHPYRVRIDVKKRRVAKFR